MTIGVLAFQGDFAEHIQILRSLNVDAIEVRTLEELNRVDRLIIPGGESTVMAKFLEETGMGKEIVRRATLQRQKGRRAEGQHDTKTSCLPAFLPSCHPLFVYGTCAGAILLAKKANGKNAPKTLGLIDIAIDRNAYGTQVDSFEAAVQITGIPSSVPVAFIRAPIITAVGRKVQVLASYKGKPVLVRHGRILAGTFHPEIRGEKRVHTLFLTLSEP